MKLIQLFFICTTLFYLGQCFDITGPIDSVIDAEYSLNGDTIDVVKIGNLQYFSAFAAAGEKDWRLYGMTTDIAMGDSVTNEIMTLDGTESRTLVKTTVLESDLVLISWCRNSAPAYLESLIYRVSTGQITKTIETLYTFTQDYDVALYYIKPISKSIYAIALVRTRSITPDTNGLIVVHKNGTLYLEQQYYDNEWRPFGIEIFTPTFSVMSLNLTCGCVHVQSYYSQDYFLGESNIFNVSGEPTNIMHVRTGDTIMFLYTIENKLLAAPYDLNQQTTGSEQEIMTFSGSTEFIHVGADSLAPGVVAIAYDTLYVMRSVNAAFRTTVYDVETRDQRMNDVVLESNSLSGSFGVAGVDEYTHIVALFRCNDTVSIGDCPGHMVLSHMIFRQPSPPVDVPPLPETPQVDAGTVPIAAHAPVTATRPQSNNNVASASVALTALSSLTLVVLSSML